MLLPYKPEEGAQGPFPLSTGLAKGSAEGNVISGDVVKGAES